jgi:hypothetical protein
MPPKKSIKETVPLSNLTYDFSAIHGGEVFWEERKLEYIFEILADDPEELEELKRAFSSWVMGVQGQELHDPHIPDFHFLATYDDMTPEDDEGLDKTTLTVTFTAYPYMIANYPKMYEVELQASKQKTLQVLNESDHPVALTIVNDVGITLKIGDALTTAIRTGNGTYSALKLPKGLTDVVVTNSEAKNGTVRISFYEERF